MQSGDRGALTLLLVCFRFSEVRPVLMAAPGFARFLARLAALGGDAVPAIAVVLRRCGLTQETVTALAESHFFHTYYDALVREVDQPALLAANALLDQVARAGFATELSFFVPLLQRQLALKNEVSAAAIAVIVTFSCHPQLAVGFRDTQFVEYFRALLKIRGLEQKARLFLDNVANA
jgi:hypothetical protein